MQRSGQIKGRVDEWQGTDLLQNLVEIFFRFREHQIALTADIEAMILQVKLPPQECQVLRLLQRSKPEDNIGVYEFTRHVFGARNSQTCANDPHLQAGIHNKESHTIAAKVIKRNFYMYDFAKSVATVEQAVQVYKDVGNTLKLGGLNLLKRIFNDDWVIRTIREGDRS